MAESTVRASSSEASVLPLEYCALLQDETELHSTPFPVHVNIDDLDDIRLYNLGELAAEVESPIHGDSKELAKEIVKKCVDPDDTLYRIETDKALKLKDRSISMLPDCAFKSEGNRGDVLVFKDSSTLLYIEVHSKAAYVPTARKTVLLLFGFVRLLKAFGVSEPEITAFVFPRIDVKRCVVKVSLRYDSTSVSFRYSIKCLTKEEVCLKLLEAIRGNQVVCLRAHDRPLSDKYAVYLTTLECNSLLNNSQLCKSKFGILLMNSYKCLKKPILRSSVNQLARLVSGVSISQGIVPAYQKKPHMFYLYNKICHDPLTDDEAKDCCLELVEKVYEVICDIHKNDIMHCDLRMPNICFNEQYMPVLIDLDFWEEFSPFGRDVDMEMFGGELLRLFPQQNPVDDFIKEFMDGKFKKSLLRNSVVSRGTRTLEEVINSR
ncbi:uncharacterized protein [Dysidea avara]|uniref:uncharacterized protein n=1 Tax=Dysidea avara TaxID=196820 RepID=UPI0033194CA3